MIPGDCIEQLVELPTASVDAVVTDPPYGIGFLGAEWDGSAIRKVVGARHRRLSANEAFQAWCALWAVECLRALKPGAHLLAFGWPRNAHRLACAFEDVGFELRDTLMWLYGTGVPESRRLPGGRATALSPAHEPILLARRPLDGTVLYNVELYGTGALNTEACRVGGRYPANVALSHSPSCRSECCQDDCAVALVDAAANRNRAKSARRPGSRLFYCTKANRRERDAGCERLSRHTFDLFPYDHRRSPAPTANPHPTVKPLELMRWLVRLSCPADGLVLDPFCGSGSTGAAAVLEGRRFIGIERDPGYVAIAQARIAHWACQPQAEST